MDDPLCVSTEELRAVGVELASSEENYSDDSGAETEVEEASFSMDPKRVTTIPDSQSKKRNVAHEDEAVDGKCGGLKRGKRSASGHDLPPKNANQKVLRLMSTVKHTLDRIKTKDNDRFKFHLTAEYRLHGKLRKQDAKKTFEFGERFELNEYVTKSQLQRELQGIRENSSNKQVAASNPLRTPPRGSAIPIFPSPASATETIPRSACQKKQCSYWKSAKVWVSCESERCQYRVHAKCLGYPSATESVVKNMPPFYCPIHNDLL